MFEIWISFHRYRALCTSVGAMSQSSQQQQQLASAADETLTIAVDERQSNKPNSEDNGVTVDIDELKAQLSIDKIL